MLHGSSQQVDGLMKGEYPIYMGTLRHAWQLFQKLTRSFCTDMAAEPYIPSFNEIRSKTFECFNKTPCAWQVHVCKQVLCGDCDIISIAGTGMGKTLTFWMPLLFRPQGIQIIVTPLNILGEQNSTLLDRLGIKGIFISAATATEHNFQVGFCRFSV